MVKITTRTPLSDFPIIHSRFSVAVECFSSGAIKAKGSSKTVIAKEKGILCFFQVLL